MATGIDAHARQEHSAPPAGCNKVDAQPIPKQPPRLQLPNIIEDHPSLTVFVVALAARLCVVAFLTVVFGGSISLDDSTYSQMAADYALENTSAWDSYIRNLWGFTATFLIPLSFLYEIFGAHSIAGPIYVAVLGSATAAFTTRLAMQVLARRWALASGMIVALLPSQVLWSSVTLKDAAVWMIVSALALVVALAARATGGPLIGLVFAIGGLMGLLAFLRQHTLIVVAWALMIAVWLGIREGRFLRVAASYLFAIAIPLLLGLGPAGWLLISDHDYSLQEVRTLNAVGAESAIVPIPTEDAPEDISTDEVSPDEAGLSEDEAQVMQALAEQPSVASVADETGLPVKEVERIRAAAEKKIATATEARGRPPAPARPLDPGPAESLAPNLAHLPRGLSVMLLEPFPLPWQGSAPLRMAKSETIVWYPILIAALFGLLSALRKPQVMLFALLFGGATILVYALTEGNVGTAFRHRGEFVWVVALLAGFGMSRISTMWEERRGKEATPPS